MEILRQHRASRIDAIFVPVGGGGLIAGIAALRQARCCPEVRIIGVEPDGRGRACTRSLQPARRASRSTASASFADGVAVQQVGDETFRLAPRSTSTR